MSKLLQQRHIRVMVLTTWFNLLYSCTENFGIFRAWEPKIGEAPKADEYSPLDEKFSAGKKCEFYTLLLLLLEV